MADMSVEEAVKQMESLLSEGDYAALELKAKLAYRLVPIIFVTSRR